MFPFSLRDSAWAKRFENILSFVTAAIFGAGARADDDIVARSSSIDTYYDMAPEHNRHAANGVRLVGSSEFQADLLQFLDVVWIKTMIFFGSFTS